MDWVEDVSNSFAASNDRTVADRRSAAKNTNGYIGISL